MKTCRPLISVAILMMVAALLCSGIGLLRNAQGEQQQTDEKIFARFMKAESEKQTEAKDTAQTDKTNDATADYMPDFSPIVLENEQAKSAMFSAFKSYYEYRARGFEHRRQVFDWQLFSAKIIFCVVIFLVLTGVYFSWVQFHKRMDGMKTGQAHNGTPGINDDMTTLSASANEIKISSPVLGVIILIISLLFFYLYLIYVFPIEEIL